MGKSGRLSLEVDGGERQSEGSKKQHMAEEMILGASFDSHGGGGEEKEKPGVIGCYACQNPISSGFYSILELNQTFLGAVMFVVIKKKGFGYSYKNPEFNILFNACTDCRLVEIAHKAEADAIKEAGRIKIEHEGHPQYTLTLQLRRGSFRCDACNTKDEGLFYLCYSCDFWIHKTCAFLDASINLPHQHNHPLFLVYSLPEM
ncbi:uncharacterized protein LOC128126887 [Lactuca sativa]|uniref:uncharacterized protein LOC128126887 n=1 Tax=Lactuca sativa TaxID=4236 RepID=UPI0022B06B89|nr:uncharacterized protein LOC128126887 [Lactuca sativa]